LALLFIELLFDNTQCLDFFVNDYCKIVHRNKQVTKYMRKYVIQKLRQVQCIIKIIFRKILTTKINISVLHNSENYLLLQDKLIYIMYGSAVTITFKFSYLQAIKKHHQGKHGHLHPSVLASMWECSESIS